MTWFDYLRHTLEHSGEADCLNGMADAGWTDIDAGHWLTAERTGRTRLHAA
jgi:hypothetical protein